ncbi:MAG: helix-turn-helix domain-containing protein [Hydrogenophaga sp.]
MNDTTWRVDWRAARARAPHEGASLLRQTRSALRCERIGLTAGLALCQVQGHSEQALTLEAPAVSEPRVHWQFLADGAGRLLDPLGEHDIAPETPMLFAPPSGGVAWQLPRRARVHLMSLDVTASALGHWCDSRQAHELLFGRAQAVVLDLGHLRSLNAQLRTLLHADHPRGPTWRLQCESLALQLLAEGLGHLGLQAPSPHIGPADRTRLRRARECLLEAPTPPVTMLALAQSVGLPLRRLQRLYEQEHGEPLKQALYRARLEAARRALLEGGASIKQVAWRAGYAHATSFTHAFKAYWGHAPSELTSRRAPGDRGT